MSFLFSDGAIDVIPDSVIHRYNFENNSDTTTLTDTVGNADGSITGMSYTTSQSDGIYAGDFDGQDDEVSLPTAESPPLTVMFDFYPRVVSGSNESWFSWGFDFNNDQGFVIKSNDNALNVIVGNEINLIAVDPSVSANTRYNCALTITSSWDFELYLDGASERTFSREPTNGLTNTSYIGSEGGNNYADVIIDDLDVDNTVLSQSEIQSRID